MRITWTGVVATSINQLIGVAWVLGTGAPLWWLAWFVVVGAFGLFIPGEANQVTLERAYLAAPALVYGVDGRLGYLAIVVAVAGLTDLVDGTVARRFNRPTQFGGGLDPVVDGVFMGALSIGLAVGGVFPVWLALVVIARYLLPAVAGGLLLAMGRRPQLRHTLMGQVSTVLILVLLGGTALLRGLNQDASGFAAGAEVVIPIATVATYVHLAWSLRRPVASREAGYTLERSR
ncbi:MAG TPA: CDP-alcohol phosphatidyltransferase family protein [Gemmatimonadales bacterium]|nr:CDP-alcohol phosphatidyltransferase family protein [Gemmatimonadales bacterium]